MYANTASAFPAAEGLFTRAFFSLAMGSAIAFRTASASSSSKGFVKAVYFMPFSRQWFSNISPCSGVTPAKPVRISSVRQLRVYPRSAHLRAQRISLAPGYAESFLAPSEKQGMPLWVNSLIRREV